MVPSEFYADQVYTICNTIIWPKISPSRLTEMSIKKKWGGAGWVKKVPNRLTGASPGYTKFQVIPNSLGLTHKISTSLLCLLVKKTKNKQKIITNKPPTQPDPLKSQWIFANIVKYQRQRRRHFPRIWQQWPSNCANFFC